MSRSSDLVPYLQTPGGRGDPISFRQGEVVTWDQETAENVIKVGDGLFENLPCLNTSEASLLIPGDVVGILVAGSTWAVMGRLIIPGSPEAASSIRSITNRIQAAEDPFAGTRNSTAWGDLTGVGVGPSVTLKVGSSGRALCFWSCELGQTLSTSSGGVLVWETKNTPHVGVAVSGASTIAANDLNALNVNIEFPAVGQPNAAQALFWLQGSMMHLFTGLTPGITTFTMKYRHDGQSPASWAAFGAREIAVFAL
jgi:hypothetical protein